MATPSVTSARGRPRDPDTDRRILDAALQLLGRDGYARMSMDAVAALAEVTKPTIYRRYPSKADLASAALKELATARDATAPESGGDVRDRLIAHLRHFQEGIERPFGIALVGTVLAEEHETPELLELYRALIVRPRRHMIRQVLLEASARGEVADNLDLESVTSALIGSYYATYLENGSVDRAWPERAVATVMAGLLPRSE